SGAGRSLISETSASAQILPMALATLPDFGTGSPVVASPITWTLGRFTDSYVRWSTSHQRLSAPTRSETTAMAPARWGGMRFTTSYLTLPKSVRTSRVPGSTPMTRLDPRYSRFGYASHALRNSAVFEI